MTQPPAYTPSFSFTDHSTEQPTVPQPGVSLDAEFNAVAVTLAAVLANLLLIQRDDGALRNGIVGVETLSTAALALINASNGISASAWVTAHAYTAGTDWVSQGTGTYICAISHTSGTFATDLAAERWVLIFDSAGTIPANGSVTTAKIADGAVTLAKLAITMLDLTGTLRAQGGLAAGTASVGELLAAKKSTGDVYAKIQRATKAQGEVGLSIEGGTGGINWKLRQNDGSDQLELYDGTVRVTWTGGLMDVAGYVRAVDAVVAPTTGAGIGFRFNSNAGYLDVYDYDASAWRAGNLRGLSWAVVCGGVTAATFTAAGASFPVDATLGAGADPVGYRNIPQNRQDGAYTLGATDAGGCIFSKNVAGQAITIPANADVAIPVEFACAIRNRGSNAITLIPAAGVTLRWAGSSGTGSRTLSTSALASLYQEEANSWVVTGAGIS